MTDDTEARPTVIELLEFERSQQPRHTGRKTAAIQARFGLAAGPYYRRLLDAAHSEEGRRHDGLLARQIRDRFDSAHRLRIRLIARRTS